LNLKPRHYLSAALLLCLLAATGLGQWVEDSIDCGARLGRLCYNTRSSVVYGADDYGMFVAISAESNKVVSSTPFYACTWVEYDSLDNKAYCFVRTPDYDTLMVMDGTTHKRIGQIPIEWAGVGVWNPDNNRLYVTMGEEDKVAVVDCSRDSIIAKIRTGQYPLCLSLNRRHQKLYACNNDGESVSIVDLATNEVTRTIRLGNVPNAGCYSTVADKFYCGGNAEVVVIDGAGDTVVARVPCGSLPTAMAESPAHGLVMVVVDDSVLVVNTSTDSIASRLKAGSHPYSIIWSPRTDLAYTANYSRDVTVIAGDGSGVLTMLQVGLDPAALVLAPDFGRLYVGHASDRFLYVIRDTASGIHEGPPSHCGPRIDVAKPNPFRRQVSIECGSDAGGVAVHAQDGGMVAKMQRSSGHGRYTWNGRTASGAEVPSGVYFAVTRSGACRVRMVKL
jgi:YVTN family beta-propeller protein